jgi:hypothetical protein
LKAYRSENDGILGVYFSLQQAIAITPIVQGTLFGLNCQMSGHR